MVPRMSHHVLPDVSPFKVLFWNFCIKKEKDATTPPTDLDSFFQGGLAEFFEMENVKSYS